MPFSIETLKAGGAAFTASIFGGTSDASIKPLPTTRDKLERTNNASPSNIPLGAKFKKDDREPFASLFEFLGLSASDLKDLDTFIEDISTIPLDINLDSFLESAKKLNFNDKKDMAAFHDLVKKDFGSTMSRVEEKMASSPFFQKRVTLNPPAAMGTPTVQSKMATARAMTTSSHVTPYQLDLEETVFAHLEIPQVGTGSTSQAATSKMASPIVTRNETVIANFNMRSKYVKEYQETIKELKNENEELKNQNIALRAEAGRNEKIITELRQEVTQNGELIQQQQLINQNLLDSLNALHQRFDAFERSRSSSRATSRSSRSHRSNTLSVQAETRPVSPTDLIDRLSIRPTLLSSESDSDSSQHLSSYSSSSEPNQAFIMPRAEVESEFSYSSEEESSDMHSSVYTISDSGDSSYIAMSPRSLPDNHAHNVA